MSTNKHHVVTTINPATAVTCSLRANFVHASEDSLIVCKGSTVEIYNIHKEGIKSFAHFSIYGVISCMTTCLIPDQATCSLFLLTDQNRFTIISYSRKTQTFITEGHGVLEEVNARVTDQPIAVIVDTKTNAIIVSSHTGLVFVIPFVRKEPKGKGKELKQPRFQPSAIRTHEFDFLSMVSCKGFVHPTITALLGEINELKTIKTFRYGLNNVDLIEVEKATVKVESTTHTLIAVPEPIGGVLAIGEYIISYHDLASGGTKELSVDLVFVTAYTFLKGSMNQCVLGDSEGCLYLLTLEISHTKVVGISSSIIGHSSIPTSIVDLGNNLLYIGSSQGDPCVVQLMQEDRVRTVNTLQTFPNLGPIMDFCLFDYDGQGKQTMVCCSGVDKDGSLRIVENGVGFVEQYIINFPLLTSVWTLMNREHKHDTLIMTTPLETIVVTLQSPQTMKMKECQTFSAMIKNEATLAMGVTKNGYIIQVTPSSVRLMEYSKEGKLLHEWQPPHGAQIALAKLNPSQCVLCYGNGMLVYLDVAENTLIQKCVKQFPDIACISLSPKHENSAGIDLVLIGMWTENKVQILQLADFNSILVHSLESVTGPKDIMLIRLEGMSYLMILQGDGQMLSYGVIYKNSLPFIRGEKRTMVGTYCTAMYPFVHEGERKIFITGIRPTIISSWHQKLIFSAVNLKNVYALAPFNDMIILMTDNGLLFGNTDTAQKLHHSKVKLNNEMPVRIQYMPQSKSLAVGTVLNVKDLNNGFIKRVGKIQILDAQTFQVLDTYQLPENEIVESMTMAQFYAYPNAEYLFVGTVIENTEDPDQNLGRILVFDLKESNKCELVESIQMPGVVYNLKPFQNSVIACVNGSIFTLQSFHPDLPLGSRVEFKLNLHNNSLALYMDTEGDRVLIGDLMRSVSVLTTTNKDPLSLRLMAVDNKPSWMTAVKFVNENLYIGSDDRNNVFTLSLNTPVPPPRKNAHLYTSPSGIQKLDIEGGFHIGSQINCFRQGILLDVLSNSQKKKNDENDMDMDITATEAPFTFATVHGSIGTIKTISEESFHFFKRIQDKVLKEVNNVGELDHALWRSYKPKIAMANWQQQQQPNLETNYLDGDLLRSFHYMDTLEKTKIVNSLNAGNML